MNAKERERDRERSDTHILFCIALLSKYILTTGY